SIFANFHPKLVIIFLKISLYSAIIGVFRIKKMDSSFQCCIKDGSSSTIHFYNEIANHLKGAVFKRHGPERLEGYL
ncbi:MAG: hypothetical protein JWQ09_2820, partial [Segetibacter sp.]|nr:hypothetical protein [Segetibacter sp.]